MTASVARGYPIWKLHLEAARRSESKAQLDMDAIDARVINALRLFVLDLEVRSVGFDELAQFVAMR
jgi:hypothetical protein